MRGTGNVLIAKLKSQNKKARNRKVSSLVLCGGGTGIRTLGGLLTHAGFQDRCFQPLSHPSGRALCAQDDGNNTEKFFRVNGLSLEFVLFDGILINRT